MDTKQLPFPSLLHLSCISAAYGMYRHPTIKKEIAALIYNVCVPPDIAASLIPSQPIHTKVIQHLPLLPLPPILTSKIEPFVESAGLEILRFAYFLYSCRLGPHFTLTTALDHICWTAFGRISKKPTVDALLRSRNIDVRVQYELACHYCCEQKVHVLWDQMLYTDKVSLSFSCDGIVKFWTYYLKDDPGYTEFLPGFSDWVHDKYSEACSYAIEADNVHGFRFFFNRLTASSSESVHALRVRFIHEAACQYAFDTLLHLLPLLDEEGQRVVYTSCGYEILRTFLFWPEPHLLLVPTLKRVFGVLGSAEIADVLLKLLLFVESVVASDGKKSRITIPESGQLYRYVVRDRYLHIVQQLWFQTPLQFKQFVTGEVYRKFDLLAELFSIGDMEIIHSIMGLCDAIEKPRLLCSTAGVNLCISFLRTSDYDTLNAFLAEHLTPIQISVFKVKVINGKGRATAERFLQSGDLERAVGVLQWCIPGEEELRGYKMTSITPNSVDSMLATISSNAPDQIKTGAIQRWLGECVAADNMFTDCRRGSRARARLFLRYASEYGIITVDDEIGHF